MSIDELLSEVEKLNALHRKHASFFQWHDKAIQEFGIAQDFVDQFEKICGEKVVHIARGSDPPDIIIRTEAEHSIGIEITELVDEDAIKFQIAGDARYFERVVHWNDENIREKIIQIVQRKDRLCAKAALIYDELLLLIFTDEPKLRVNALMRATDGVQWPKTGAISQAYIIVGYDPSVGTKAVIQLF